MSLERGADVLCPSDFKLNNVEPKRLSGRVNLVHFHNCGGKANVGQDRQTAQRRDNFAQEFEPFARKIGCLKR